MTIRLDRDRYQRLRREAYEREVKQSDIVREALDAHFTEYFSQSFEARHGGE